MSCYLITGGTPLRGTVRVRGAKNSALKLMAASLLAEGTYRLREVPQIADIETMRLVLRRLGCDARFEDGTMAIEVPAAVGGEAPYELVRQMRASIVVLGPLLARRGRARVAMPGGCNIGSRKIDLHLKGLERMGATIGFDHGYLEASGGLHGAEIVLDWPSHGATENICMAATLAKGTTVIENAARDPEIQDLSAMLSDMGARISGAGTPTIVVEGTDALRAVEHTVLPDRLEAGTYLIAAAATGGDVTVEGARGGHLEIALSKLADSGAEVDAGPASVRLRMPGTPRPVDFVTLPYPGFPTDLQPQMMVLCAIASGTSIATENVFENRFMFVDELVRMGADIRTEGHHAVIRGRPRLEAAPVRAPDIRAGAALAIAGLVADGETELSGVDHIERGYESFDDRLRALGGRIERLDG
ncbi:MAG: UDP-N-acetylglucosamine 1-carboxyvinyltransferase [Acidobacteria bacterium]|nr:UDP-N-acetylglucosamine 1-carboxyvinyltransferase [Acidobacteriota bacterium]